MSYPPQGTGGAGLNNIVTEITTSTTLDSSYYIVLCDASSDSITVTLPPSSSYTGKAYNIKKTDSSGNAITINGHVGNVAETIDESTTKSLNLQNEALTIVCNGSNWYII